jgi:hypothetical protein
MLTEYTHIHWNGRLAETRNPQRSFFSTPNGTRKRGLRDTITSRSLLFHVKTRSSFFEKNRPSPSSAAAEEGEGRDFIFSRLLNR